MNRPSSRSNLRPWHQRIEDYTPDGALGRVLFGAAMSPIVTFFVWLAGIGVLGPGLLSLLLLILSIVAGLGVTLLGLVVLWPVYLSLIGNLESPEAYGTRGSNASPESDEGDDPIAVLKRQYAAGKLSQEEFERRLDTLLDVEESDPSHEEDFGLREYDHT